MALSSPTGQADKALFYKSMDPLRHFVPEDDEWWDPYVALLLWVTSGTLTLFWVTIGGKTF